MKDIVDIAVAAGGFKTFIAAIQAAGLAETLKGPGPFTIFAPDDRAFGLLPEGTVDGLLKNIPKLKAILMYHVIPGKLTVDEIGQLKTAKTVQGQEIKIDGSKWHLHMNPVINNDAHIVNTDVVTDNGMVQVVDRVLMPNMDLTCPVCGMGFMTMEALNVHTKMGHLVEKTPEPTPVVVSTEVTPIVEKMPEPTDIEAKPEPMPEATKEATGVFEIMCDAAGKFRFNLKATNGQIIAVSQSYGTRESALKGIVSIKKNAPIAKTANYSSTENKAPETTDGAGIVENPVFEIICDAANKIRFHLKAANGQIIAVSQSYGSIASAEKGIASIKNNAPMARVVDHTMAAT